MSQITTNYGLISLKRGDFNPTTGAITNLVEIPVYRDTMNITETLPTATKHYRAGKTSPIKIALQGGAEMATFKVPQTDTEMMALLLGGTEVVVSGKGTWNKAKGTPQEKIAALVATTLDGYVYTITRGSWRANKEFNASETNIYLINVEVEVTDTGIDAVSDVTWAEPAA